MRLFHNCKHSRLGLRKFWWPDLLACNHPCLVTKDYKADHEAVEPKAAKNATDERDGDDLAEIFGQLGVTRRCQVCQTE